MENYALYIQLNYRKKSYLLNKLQNFCIPDLLAMKNNLREIAGRYGLAPK